MDYIEISSLTHNAYSSLLLNEIENSITERYNQEEYNLKKEKESIPGTKGIITTALVIEFVTEIVQRLTVEAIKAIASMAVKKIFTKKEAGSVQILIEDNKVIVKSNGDVNIDIVIRVE